MKYKSIMFFLMGILLVGTTIGFYEYSNDDGNYLVIEKPNIDRTLFISYESIIYEIYHIDGETHIQIIEEENWAGEIGEFYNLKQDLGEFAEALDVQGNLETSLGSTTYLCLTNDLGKRVGCFVRDYGTLNLMVCEEGVLECEE